MKLENYSQNKNVQMLISLMLVHGVKRVVVSPGTTHMEIVAGLQLNGGFEMYSSIDERGAAYMACGLAARTGEPVAIICTESVASRNYNSAMTDAYYRQLPILAITGVHGYSKIGHLHTQIIDRSVSPKDTFRLKVQLPVIKDAEDAWTSNVLINKALLELRHRGGGPVHIDLPASERKEFTAKSLCKTRAIYRHCSGDALPELAAGGGKIAVLLGTHAAFSGAQESALDAFCAAHDAVVFCGHTSGYRGKYAVTSCLAASQGKTYDMFRGVELLIHVGGPVADEKTQGKLRDVREVWRVSPDGELCDTFKRLTHVFEMEEEEFFRHYCIEGGTPKTETLEKCLRQIDAVQAPVDRLPFSNVYIASVLSKRLPEGSLVHFGMSNSIRAWSFFALPQGVSGGANSGTRGIDGVLSAFVGASLVDKRRICFLAVGDLAFFYDMNALNNKALGANVRILLVNDNGGGLMKMSESPVHQSIGDEAAEDFLVAGGHFGGKGSNVVKAYAEALGFEYLAAHDKESFGAACERFVSPELTEKPMLLEAFTDAQEERRAFDMMGEIDTSIQSVAKKRIKRILGPKGINMVKKVIRSGNR